MRVEIWSDLICPWCGLGQHRLEKALAQFEHKNDVTLEHHSFQLDRRAPTETVPVRDLLGKKYRMSAAQVEATTGRVAALAKQDGLEPYIVLENKSGNTQLAHELAAWATEQDKESEVWHALYKKYFGEAGSIFDIDSLVAIPADIGLSADDARVALTSHRYADKVIADEEEAQAMGATGVPFIVIDRKFGIAGAQSTEVFLEALNKAWADR